MFCPVFRIWLLLLLGGFAVPGVRHVCCIEISTSGEVEAVNGTDVKLKCTFTSSSPVSEQSVIVSWYFRPLLPGQDESVFYYQKEPFPPDQGRFKGHAVWSGDILRKDASITLQNVLPTFNGTYICQVRNTPDVHGRNGEITLKVVEKVSFSEITVLALAVGAGIVLILIILSVVVFVKICRKRRMRNDIEMHVPDKWKDPTVCKPEEAVLLNIVSKKKEADSSDDEESEPSSGDEDEEHGDGDDKDGDDDDDD